MFESMKAVISKTTGDIFDTTMAKLNPEYRGVSALASAMAFLVMADRKVEEEEMNGASEYLLNIDIVVSRGLTREVSEFFLETIDKLSAASQQGSYQYNITSGDILTTISRAKDEPEWSKVIADTVKMVTSGSKVDKSEVDARNKILRAIGYRK